LIPDFWLGALLATTAALAIIVLAVVTAAAWALAWLGKFASIDLKKDKAGGVVASVEVRK
jgi:hypothetical protein